MPIEPEGMTVNALIAALKRRRWVLVLCALLFPAVAFIAANQLTPRYTASATVMFEPEGYNARELQSILRDETTTDAVLASQVEIIRSLSISRRIVRQFDLTERAEFSWWLEDAKRADTPWFRLRDALAAGMSVRDAAAAVAEATGLPRKQVYARALELGRG
jgi:uncharacterized protein involved in exopolysaccharide biosynthesis